MIKNGNSLPKLGACTMTRFCKSYALLVLNSKRIIESSYITIFNPKDLEESLEGMVFGIFYGWKTGKIWMKSSVLAKM